MLENQLSVRPNGQAEMQVRPSNLATDLGNPDYGLWTSLDRTKVGDQAIMVKCLGTADKRSDDVLNTIISVRHILAHNVDLSDSATGEITPSVRIVFFLMDGTTVGTVSKGIFSSVQAITSIVGMPPYDTGLNVRIKPVATRNGFKTLVLEFLGVGAVQDNKPKKGEK